MKTCFKCGVNKDLADFYKHPKMADGRVNKCKECNKMDVRENRAAKADQYRAYDAKRYQDDPAIRERHRLYQKTEAGKASLRRSRRRWLKENAEKRAAHVMLNNAVRDGRSIKPDTCEKCGASNCRIEGHHDDYALPLAVEWLCRKCHVDAHRPLP